MPKANKGTEFVCGYCGTTLLVTREGPGCVEDIICCDAPMKIKKSAAKSPKAKKAKKSKKK